MPEASRSTFAMSSEHVRSDRLQPVAADPLKRVTTNPVDRHFDTYLAPPSLRDGQAPNVPAAKVRSSSISIRDTENLERLSPRSRCGY